MVQVTSEGDAGDVLYGLCVTKHIPNGPHELLIEEKSPYTNIGRNDGAAKGLLDFIHDFILDQPYISDCRMMAVTDRPYWRSGGFRGAGLHRRNEPLMFAHLNHLNQVTGLGLKINHHEPWLTSEASPKTKGRVVVNRTFRYNNTRFPWEKIVGYYGDRIAFVGLLHEHQTFCAKYGNVEFLPTKTLKELASLIKGSALFIGNQSCANAVAEGLKHPSIQETSLYIPDCIFKRDNMQHVWDGGCKLPNLDGGEPLQLRPKGMEIGLVSTMKTPPYPGWTYPGVPHCETFYQCYDLVSQLSTMRGKPQKEIEDAIKQVALDRCPEYYRPPTDGDTVRQALQFADTH